MFDQVVCFGCGSVGMMNTSDEEPLSVDEDGKTEGTERLPLSFECPGCGAEGELDRHREPDGNWVEAYDAFELLPEYINLDAYAMEHLFDRNGAAVAIVPDMERAIDLQRGIEESDQQMDTFEHHVRPVTDDDTGEVNAYLVKVVKVWHSYDDGWFREETSWDVDVDMLDPDQRIVVSNE